LFDCRLIFLKKWDEKIGIERDLLTSIPIWVEIALPSSKVVVKACFE